MKHVDMRKLRQRRKVMRVRMPDEQGDRARNLCLEVPHGDAQQRRPDACDHLGRRLGRLHLRLRGQDRARPGASKHVRHEHAREGRAKGDLVAIRSTVTRTNVGQAELRVLGLTYNVVGVRTRFGEAPAAGAMPEQIPRSSNIAQARYYDEPEGGEVILRYGVLFEGACALPSERSALNPGEAVSRDLIFYADPTRFDSIRFQVELSYAKMSEPPVPSGFEASRDGRIAAVPGRTAKPRRCGAGPWSRPTSARNSPSGDLEPITDATR